MQLIGDLLTRKCTIIRRLESAEADEFGNEVPDEQYVDTVCEIQQRTRTEPAGAGELSITDWLGIFKAGTVLRTGDAVVTDEGATYEVVGDSWAACDPFQGGAPDHVEASLRQTRGTEDGS